NSPLQASEESSDLADIIRRKQTRPCQDGKSCNNQAPNLVVNLSVLSPAPSGSSGHKHPPLQRNADDDNTDYPAVYSENAQPVPHQEANEKPDGDNAGNSGDADPDSVK